MSYKMYGSTNEDYGIPLKEVKIQSLNEDENKRSKKNIIILAIIVVSSLLMVTAGSQSITSVKPTLKTRFDVVPSSTEIDSMFEDFKVTFERSYEDDEEEAIRRQQFEDNLNKIVQLNNNNPKATYALNRFADYTDEEYDVLNSLDNFRPQRDNMKKFNTFLTTWDAEANICPACERFSEISDYSSDNIPDSWDWRDYGAVTEVKNQKECGSCWAFSTTGDLEGGLYLTGEDLVALSEQQLVACDVKVDQGCNGGLQEYAFMYAESTSIVLEDEYPYRGINYYMPHDSPTCGQYAAENTQGMVSVTAWFYIETTEDLLRLALIQLGPLAIAMNAEGMEYYSGGVDDPSESFCPSSYIDHAVLLVGYGTEDGTDYWLIKNSWGTEWGEDGYYKIIRNENACGVNEDVVHALVTPP